MPEKVQNNETKLVFKASNKNTETFGVGMFLFSFINTTEF